MKKRILLIFFLTLTGMNSIIPQSFSSFITCSGNRLMEGEKEFRFLSFNVPNLNYIEDEMAFTSTCPFRLPTEFEICDAILSVKQMGGRVIRIYTLPVRRSDQPESVPASILAPEVFNEDAFKINDLVLAIANELGIRIIFPLLNNWKWMGGRPQYAEFRGKDENDFWTDPQLINDFKNTIKYTLNRKNSITGIRYKEDKAILCWETGNELGCPPEWTSTIARYIKKLDKNHLVMDGYFAGHTRTIRVESLDEPAVDILTSHHYEKNPDETIANIRKNIEIINGRKPYVIGEFGFQSTTSLNNTINWLISEHAIAGALIWSLRSHREEGGFYWHSEPLGLGIYKAYHWPGFAQGDSYDELDFIKMYRQKAFEIQGMADPEPEKPARPKLLPVTDVFDINWQGSAGAAYYNLERAESKEGPWQRIALNLTDATNPYTSLYHDAEAEIGETYYYRIIAGNIAGESHPSDVVGPVIVNYQAITDNMSNFGKLFYSKNINIVTGDDRKLKEDPHRIAGDKDSWMMYLIPGKFVRANVYAFDLSGNQKLEVTGLSVNNEPIELNVIVNDFYERNNDYDSWHPLLYEINSEADDLKYLKILFLGNTQISRVEIIYK